MSSNQNLNCDLLVIGSGAGGLSAAVTAAHLGMKVIVLEKEPVYGGTSAWSGGWLWIPRNFLAQKAGIQEDINDPIEYLKNELGSQFNEEKIRTFLEKGPQMVEFFHTHTELKFLDGNKMPDFHGKTAKAVTGGRSVYAAPFDGKKLGKELKRLRQPLDVVSLWGMGIGSGIDMKNFFNATRSFQSFSYVAKRVLHHFLDLIIYRQGTQLYNGNALIAALAKTAFDRRVQILTNVLVKKLMTENGKVSGAVFQVNDEIIQITSSRGVVLACGGFPHDTVRKSVMFSHAPTGEEHHSAATPSNTGDGIRLGESVGAVFTSNLHSAAGWAPVSLVPKSDGSFSRFPHLIERGKPGLIAVKENGQRFTNEANSYYDFMTDLFNSSPKNSTPKSWLICDHSFIKRWGLGAVKPAPKAI